MATLQTDDSDQPKTDRWIMLDAFCQSQTTKLIWLLILTFRVKLEADLKVQ